MTDRFSEIDHHFNGLLKRFDLFERRIVVRVGLITVGAWTVAVFILAGMIISK